MRQRGHLVLIGAWFRNHGADEERILENSIFLVPGQGPIRVLEYVQYGGSTDVSPGVHTFVQNYASSAGRPVTFAALSNYLWLASALPGFDVLLVHDQISASSGAMQTVANAWSSALASFLDRGGVVIVLSGNQRVPGIGVPLSYGETYRVATGPGLLKIPGIASSYGNMELAAPGSAVAAGVAQSYAAAALAYLAFPGVVGGTVVVRDHSTLDPVVIELTWGKPCSSSLDCAAGPGKICDVASGKCVACQVDADCKNKEHCTAGACTPPRLCASSSSCAGALDGRTICDPASSECVGCAGDGDCQQGRTCATDHFCRLPCTDNVPCAALQPPLVCDTTAGMCTECSDATQCAPNQFCKGGRCVADTCIPGSQSCSANGIHECDPTGSAMTVVQSCGVGVCTPQGTTASCETLPDAGPRCPAVCPPCFIGGPPGCCTPQFTCGCTQAAGNCQ